MSKDSSYPSTIIPMNVLQDMAKFYVERGWTWLGKTTTPTPIEIEDAINELLVPFYEEDAHSFTASGGIRLCKIDYGDEENYNISICLEYGRIKIPKNPSSPTTKIEEASE